MMDMTAYQLQASNQMLGEIVNQMLMLRAENLALRATIAAMQADATKPPEDTNAA